MKPAHALRPLILLLLTASVTSAQPAQLVVVETARVEPMAAMRTVTGDIRTKRQSLVAAQVDGFVIECSLLAGDAVETGQVIARLDPELAELEVERASATLAASEGVVAEREALLDQAKRDLERFRAADRGGSMSATELDGAETTVRTREAELAQARADAASARAELAREERMLRDKTIRAPFAGVVVEKLTELGEWVSAGDPIVELVSVRELEAIIEVPQQFVGLLQIGSDPIRISVPGLGNAGEASATIDAIVPLADELSRLFPVRLGIPNESGVLKPGMSLTAHVPTGRIEPTLTVHKDAIRRDDAGEFLFMAVPHSVEGNPAVTGQAIPARITRLYAVGDRVAIRPGQVRDGSVVLVEGNERVYPTQGLIIQNPPPGSPFASAEHPAEGG